MFCRCTPICLRVVTYHSRHLLCFRSEFLHRLLHYVQFVISANIHARCISLLRHVTFLADNDVNAHYHYLVAVLTGMKNNSGTTANVSMVMFGDKGTSHRYVLAEKNVELFQVGSEDWFLVAVKSSLGNMKKLIVWHDCSGMFPTWWVTDTPMSNLEFPCTHSDISRCGVCICMSATLYCIQSNVSGICTSALQSETMKSCLLHDNKSYFYILRWVCYFHERFTLTDVSTGFKRHPFIRLKNRCMQHDIITV